MATKKRSQSPGPAAGGSNLAGSARTAPVPSHQAGPMTASDMYDQNEPFVDWCSRGSVDEYVKTLNRDSYFED